MKYLYFFLIVPMIFICRAINYQRRVFFLNSFYKIYLQYIKSYVEEKKTKQRNPLHDNLAIKIQRNQIYAKTYIAEAGIGNPHIPTVTPIGLGFADTSGIAVLDNIAYLGDVRVIDNVKQCIQRAIGYYEHVRNENFNPIFWFEYILTKVPKSIIGTIVEIIKKAANP